jgi:glycosyltransferase involved in cell wall biosynthesis
MVKSIISIIIPFYNVENYLMACLNSICNQTFKNFEIILINDGSTDKSLIIANSFIDQHPEIKINLINQLNYGQGYARNIGLKFAQGEYISFIDSDDLIETNMLEEMLNVMLTFDLEVLNCGNLNFYKNSKLNHIFKLKSQYNKKLYDGKNYFNLQPSVSPCDKLYKNSFLKNINFQFIEGHYAEDVLALSQIYYYAKRVMYLDKVLYNYRRNSNNSTRNSNSNIKKRIKLSIDKLTISCKLHNFSISHNWKGYNQLLIIRNIIGVTITKMLFNMEYRKSIIERLKFLNIKSILIFNFKLSFLYDFLKIIFLKIFRRS